MVFKKPLNSSNRDLEIDLFYYIVQYNVLYSMKYLIDIGMILRVILTSLSFYMISYFSLHKTLYLILPILLTALDTVDGSFIVFYKNNQCYHTFHYQMYDKIVDSASYLLLFAFFKLDQNVLYFTLYRIIGVLLFSLKKNSKWLVLFFDFVKEYMLYVFLFSNDFRYLPICILLKILYEYYLHRFSLKRQY